jgi:hypothetical protein
MRYRLLAAVASTALLGTAVTAVPAAEAAIPEPSVSPGISRAWVTEFVSSDCPSGYLCAYVMSNKPGKYGAGWYLFKFTKCITYNLNYWHYDAWVFDHQTGGVTTRFLGQNNQVLDSMKVAGPAIRWVSPKNGYHQWDPIYKIDVC